MVCRLVCCSVCGADVLTAAFQSLRAHLPRLLGGERLHLAPRRAVERAAEHDALNGVGSVLLRCERSGRRCKVCRRDTAVSAAAPDDADGRQ